MHQRGGSGGRKNSLRCTGRQAAGDDALGCVYQGLGGREDAPDAGSLVLGRGDDARAVRAERRALDPVGVPGQNGPFLTRGRVPERRGATRFHALEMALQRRVVFELLPLAQAPAQDQQEGIGLRDRNAELRDPERPYALT